MIDRDREHPGVWTADRRPLEANGESRVTAPELEHRAVELPDELHFAPSVRR